MSRESVILITGSNGFIGRHAAGLLARDCRVIGLDHAAEDKGGGLDEYVSMTLPAPGIEAVVRDVRPDFVLHCAGSANVSYSMTHPREDFMSGPAALFELMNALRKAELDSTVIFPSSAAVYGNPERLPITENDPACPISPYGYHKFICEQVLDEFRKVYGIPSVILRIFSCYGAGLAKQLLWDVANKIRAGRLELFGTGEESRDFIHVRDLAAVIELVIRKKAKNMTLNVASGTMTSVRQMAGHMLRFMDSAHVAPEFNGVVREGDPLHWQADISVLRSLGYRPSIGLERGVAEYAQWFLKTHCGNENGKMVA